MMPVPRGAGRLAYVVDDELLLAQIFEAILKLDGFQVRMFTDPQAAWESFQLEEPKPALLVTDYAMGPLTGLELLSRCHNASSNLRSVVVSGNVGQDVFEGQECRPNAFLEKPFLPQTFIETVHSVLAEKGEA